MEQKKYLDDITEIKNMMDRSSRFLSLSGLSGILAGVYALIASGMAFYIIKDIESYNNKLQRFFVTVEYVGDLLVIALTVLIMAVATCLILSVKKAKKNGEKFWNSSSKRLLVNFAIPLLAGGIFCFNLIYHEAFKFVAPATLIFYGLACINASKYTLGDVKYLGLCCLMLGLVSGFFIGYGLLFWALGFGVCHILYGSIMYYKYDRPNI